MNDQDLIPEQKLTALLELEAGKVEDNLDLWKIIEKQVTANQAAYVPEPNDFQNIDTVPDSLESSRKVLTFPRMLKYGLGIAAVLAIAFIIGTAIQPEKTNDGKQALLTTPTVVTNPGFGAVPVVPTTTPTTNFITVTLKLTLPGHPAAVRAIGWKPDGTEFATATDDGTVNLWNNTGKLIQTFPATITKSVLPWPYRVGWSNLSSDGVSNPGIISIETENTSPDGKLVAVRTSESEFKVQQPHGEYVSTLAIPGGSFGQLAWSPDGKVIALEGFAAHTGSAGPGDIRVWLWRTDGTLITTLQDFSYPINSMSWSADSSILAIAAKGENQAGLYTADGKSIAKIGEKYVIWQLAWSPDGQTLAGACSDNLIRLFDRKGNLEVLLTGHQDTVWTVAWSPDGRTLASGSGDKTAKLWNVK